MFDLEKAKHLYFNKKVTLKEVGDILGYSYSKIRYHFSKNHIKARNNSECRVDKKRPDMRGDNNCRWNGGKYYNTSGYLFILNPNHPQANSRGYTREHILIAERILGRYLKIKEVVHHANEITSDNTNKNLVICENENYHRLLHRRKRAYESCGHANWLKCLYCKKYDNLNNLRTYFHSNGSTIRAYHAECMTIYNKTKWRNNNP